MTTETVSHLVATRDYEVFYQAWYPLVETAARNWGLLGQDAEDAIHDIFTDLMAGGYLERYDQDRAAFSTFIWSQVRPRLMTWNRKKVRRETVTPAVDLFESEAADSIDGVDHLSDKELEVILVEVYQELKTLPATQTKDLARLFCDLHDQVEMEGKTSTRKLEGKYGIKHQAISAHVKELRKLPVIQSLRQVLS